MIPFIIYPTTVRKNRSTSDDQTSSACIHIRARRQVMSESSPYFRTRISVRDVSNANCRHSITVVRRTLVNFPQKLIREKYVRSPPSVRTTPITLAKWVVGSRQRTEPRRTRTARKGGPIYMSLVYHLQVDLFTCNNTVHQIRTNLMLNSKQILQL